MITEKEITAIGKFQKTHALKGELNAILEIDEEYLVESNAIIVELDGIYVPFYVSGVRPKGATSFLIKLEGIETEDEARQFVNKTIYALKSELAPFLDIEEEDMIEEDDLIGYSVIEKETEHTIGIISDIDSTTCNVLFIVTTPEGETIYIPAAEEFLAEVDDEKKTIRMSLPDGLIDLN